MLEKNQFAEVEITDITADGKGVCRVDGMAVFVPDTAVGDRVKIKIVKVLKSYAYGIISEILNFSADRIMPDCPVYKKCGGCVFRHINYDAECRIKANIVENAFRRIGGLNPEFQDFIGAEDVSCYRNKAQYPLDVTDGKAVCGFYAERSHNVIPIKKCCLQPDVFSEILETSLEYIN
ncbi:MAG: TRAM domain-containing protein, partial [Ruminococcus sp.]|nr:TRAM domain-containing protein [Ruminococcus sp.]